MPLLWFVLVVIVLLAIFGGIFLHPLWLLLILLAVVIYFAVGRRSRL